MPRALYPPDHLAEEEARLGIESRARLVEKKDVGVVHHGPCDGEALHHPAGKSERLLICAVGELELFEERVGPFPPFLRGEAEVGAVKGEDLPRGEREVEIGTLRHDSDQPLDGLAVLPDVEVPDPGTTRRGLDSGGDDANGGGLARTVRPEEPEDLARLHLQRQSVERHDVASLLRGRVDLAQTLGFDSDRHGADCKRS